MRRARPIGGIAKAVIATLAGGPIAGVAAAAKEATDVLVEWLGEEHTPSLQFILGDVRVGLEQLARSERIPEDMIVQGVDAAQAIILRWGLSASEIVTHNLNATSVAEIVLSRSDGELSDLDESARALCRKAIELTYTSALSNAKIMPELQRAFQQAALNRLGELKEKGDEVLVALRSALGAWVSNR